MSKLALNRSRYWTKPTDVIKPSSEFWKRQWFTGVGVLLINPYLMLDLSKRLDEVSLVAVPWFYSGTSNFLVWWANISSFQLCTLNFCCSHIAIYSCMAPNNLMSLLRLGAPTNCSNLLYAHIHILAKLIGGPQAVITGKKNLFPQTCTATQLPEKSNDVFNLRLCLLPRQISPSNWGKKYYIQSWVVFYRNLKDHESALSRESQRKLNVILRHLQINLEKGNNQLVGQRIWHKKKWANAKESFLF